MNLALRFPKLTGGKALKKAVNLSSFVGLVWFCRAMDSIWIPKTKGYSLSSVTL